MKRMCRQFLIPSWHSRQLTVAQLLRHATVVTDPKKLAFLKAEVEKCKRIAEGEQILHYHQGRLSKS